MVSYRSTGIYLSMFLVGIYCLPFIISPANYQDDIGRTIWGYYDWESNGRPLATLFMQLMNFFTNVFNMAPLYIIIGLLFYIYSFNKSCCHIFNHSNFSLSLSCLISISSPFFIENLAYNFDSMTMLFSVSLAFISAFLKKSGWKMVLLQATLLLAMLSLYQATVNLYVTLVLIAYIANANKDESLIKQIRPLLYGGLSLIASYSLYSLVIAKHFVKFDYNITHSQITFHASDVIQSLHLFMELINPLKDNITSKTLFFFSFVIIYISSVFSSIRTVRMHGLKSSVFFHIFILLLTPIISVFLIIGSLAFLKYPVVSPRVLVGGIGYMFLFSYSTYNIFKEMKHNERYMLATAIPVCLFCFNFCYTFNAALKDQSLLEYTLSNKISSHLFKAGFKPSKDKLIIAGSEPRTIMSVNAIMRIPYMEKALPLYFNGNNPFGFIKLRQTYFLRDIEITDKQTVAQGMSVINLASELSENEYFKVLRYDRFFYVKFK